MAPRGHSPSGRGAYGKGPSRGGIALAPPSKIASQASVAIRGTTRSAPPTMNVMDSGGARDRGYGHSQNPRQPRNQRGRKSGTVRGRRRSSFLTSRLSVTVRGARKSVANALGRMSLGLTHHISDDEREQNERTYQAIYNASRRSGSERRMRGDNPTMYAWSPS